MKHIFKFIIIFLSAGHFLISCKSGSIEMKITEYRNGGEKIIRTGEEDSKKINEIVGELLALTDDMLRVYLDEETIASIKNQEYCIEITYMEKVNLNSAFLGTVTINKILIPLSGDYSSNEEGDSVLFLIGEDSYTASPLTTSGGFKYIGEILEIIGRNY